MNATVLERRAADCEWSPWARDWHTRTPNPFKRMGVWWVR